MDCTQVLVDSDEEANVPTEEDRRQVASLIVNEDSFPIFLGENKIGRDASSCSVVISSLALSSQHAVIQGMECGMFLIRDLNSRNKTKIGKMTLTPNMKYQLKDGDIVRFANISCTFHVERVERSSNSLDKDFPCTQAIEDADDEEAADEMDRLAIIGSRRPFVKGGHDIFGNIVKTPKALAKKPEEHVFKIPVATPTRSNNDSFGLLNESRDSSCHVDSDDEIFDLLTQPSAEEPTMSENIKGQAGGNVKCTGDESKINDDDDDDIFSAATEDFSVAHKEKGPPFTVTKDAVDKDDNASDDGGLTDEDGMFSADTEGFPAKSKNDSSKRVSEASTKIADFPHHSASKEGDATDEEDIFSAATEDFQVKIPEKGASKVGGMATKNKDAWEEYDVTDEDELFSAATEGLPMKSGKSIREKSQGGKSFGENDTSKEDDITDEDIFSAATEALPDHLPKKMLKPGTRNAIAKGSDDTDDEDIFSAATEAVPPEPSSKKPCKRNSKEVISKNRRLSEEDDTTDDEDIFSAATEALPGQPSNNKMLKPDNKRNASAKGGDAPQEGDDTDEDGIFSAATEALPAELSIKKTYEMNAKKAVSKKNGDSEGETTDEDNIFSAATEGLPGQSPKKKKMSKPDVRNFIAKGGYNPEECDDTDEDGIFSAATEAFPAEISTNKAFEKNSRKPASRTGGASEGETTDEEDIFSAATEALPGLSSKKKISKTNSGNGNSIEGDDQVTDEEDIFSAVTQAIPMSPNGQKKYVTGNSKDGDSKSVKEKEGICDNEGFVKDFLSISDSEHGACRQDVSAAAGVVVTRSEQGKSMKNTSEKQSVEGDSVGKQTGAQEIKSGMESDGGETDVEDDLTIDAKDEKTKTNSDLQSVEKESCRLNEKSKSTDIHKVNVESASENAHDVVCAPDLIDPNASIVVISDTDGEDEEESYVNSTLEKSKENRTVESSAIRHSKSQSGDVTKTAMMTIDETLPPSRIILTQRGLKATDSEKHTAGESNTTGKLGIQIGEASKSSDNNAVNDTVVKSPISNSGNVQNQSSIIADHDEDEIFVAETPVCSRNKRGKGLQISRKVEVTEEVEEDMSSFLTEAPPEFKTPLVGLKRASSGVEDLSDFEIQPTPKLSASRNPEEKGMVEGDDEEEDMSSFLTQAPPEFKTPQSIDKKAVTDGEEDMSELLTQPAPVSSDTHTPSRGEEDGDGEDMSSFLTEAPPDFKTPVAAVKQIVAEEEDDLSDFATQPAPKSTEKEDEDMSSFLTEAPPEFKTPMASVRKIIAEEEEDLSDFATQPAPKSAGKEQGSDNEEMGSFLTEVPPKFKTSVAGMGTIITEEDDLSDLMTQPAPGSEEKEDKLDERGASSSQSESSLEFKTTVSGLQKLTEEEDDMSDLATQPAPRSPVREQGNEGINNRSYGNEIQPEFKTPRAVAQKCLEEEEDWSDFGTQPAPITEDKQSEVGLAENGKPSPSSADSEFKVPKLSVKNVRMEEELDEDLCDLATQPAPVFDENEEAGKFTVAMPENKTYKENNDMNSGDDFSDLATEPAPVNEEELQNVRETDSVSATTMVKSKTPGRLLFSTDKEDDLSEIETQPAPVDEDFHSAGQKNRSGQSQEDDLSLLETQPAPTSPLHDEREKTKAPTMAKMKEEESKGKASAMCKERVLSFKGRSHLLRNVGSPKKAVFSPGKGRKALNIFADLNAQAREDDSSDSDLDFSASLPDTPDLLATLQESGNKFVPDPTTCRNLFDTSKLDEPAECAPLKGASKVKGALKRPGKSDEGVQEKQTKPNILKVSEKAKATRDANNISCPPKKSKKKGEGSDHLDTKGSDSAKDVKGFEKETGVTLAGLNDMQKIKNVKLEKNKSRTPSLLRDVVVTSTPINMSGTCVEHVGTPPESVTNAPDEITKPTSRSRRKGGGVKNEVGCGAGDLISPVVHLVDVVKKSSFVREEDLPTEAKNTKNLRLKKFSDSRVAAKAGVKGIKIRDRNVQAVVGVAPLDDPSDGSSKGKGLRAVRKRNVLSSVEEVAPTIKVAAKSGRGRKKVDADEAGHLPSGKVTQPAEIPEKTVTPSESHEGAGFAGEISESSNTDGELSPVMFYGKRPLDNKSGKSTVKKSDSSISTALKKNVQGNDSHAKGVSVNSFVGSPEAVRRSGRERKPKKRFSVDDSPLKPKRSRSDLKSLESIPTSGKVARGEKSLASSSTPIDAGVNSSRETALSSESTVSVSRKRVSDNDDESEKSSKRIRVADVGSLVQAFTRGGSRNREEVESDSVKGAMGPPAKRSGEKSKLSLKAHDLRKSVTDEREEKKNLLEEQVTKGVDGGFKGSGRGRKKRGPVIQEDSSGVSISSKVGEETSYVKQVHDQHNIMKEVRLELRQESPSDIPELTSVSQKRSSRGRNVASSEINKKRQSKSTTANSSGTRSTSVATKVDDKVKEEDPKGTVGGRNSSTSRSRRRRISPVSSDRSMKQDIGGVKDDVHPSSPKVAPLRISKGRIIDAGGMKRSNVAAVDSPVYNKSFLEESVREEKIPLRVRKHKKDSVNVLFTGLSDPKLNQVVERLGGSIVDTPQNCNVLVTDRLRRTYKLLCAIGRGIPIVTAQWLTQSSSTNRFLDPMDFLVSDRVTEKRFDFTLKSSLEKARVKPMLTGYSFIATPSVKPPPEEVKGIVTCAGGQYIPNLKALESKVTPLCYVVSCADDSGLWDEYTEVGVKKAPRGRGGRNKAASAKVEGLRAKLVGVEGLLVSVLRQKPDLENKDFSLR